MEKHSVLKDSLLDFLRSLFDLMILNWLWLLCSLPIVTIGPATSAVYAVTLKMVRDEQHNVAKSFFRAFREGFPQALVMGLGVLVGLAVAAGDAWFALQQQSSLRTMYLALAVVVALAALTLAAYGFPLQAMYRNSLKRHIGNAFALAFLSPGKTIALWLLLLLPVLTALLLPRIAVAMLGFVYVMVGFSAPMYFCSRILRGIFDKMTSPASSAMPPEAPQN